MPQIDPDTEYVRDPAVEFREAGDEIFIVDGDGQTILNLNPVGAAIWRLLEEPASPAEAIELLCQAFPMVDPARIAGDVNGLFADLSEKGFITRA